MNSPVNSQRMAYFVQVADAGSLTRAAETLGVSQPSLSAALRKLENETGVALFQRLGRGVTLTSEGERLLKDARRVIRALDEFSDTARSLSTSGYGVVNLAAPSGAGLHPLGPLVKTFIDRHPGDRVHVVRTNALADTLDAVRQGRAELGLVPRIPIPDGLEGHPIGHYELVLALAPEQRLPPGPVGLDQLDGLAVISSIAGTAAHRIVQAAERRGAHPHVVMVEPDIASIPELVAVGIGAGIIIRSMGRHGRALGLDLRLFEPREKWPVRLVHRREELSAVGERFLTLATEAVPTSSVSNLPTGTER